MLLNVMFAPSQETHRRFQAQNQGGTRSVFLTYTEKVSNRQIDLMSLKLHVPLPCEGSVSSVTQVVGALQLHLGAQGSWQGGPKPFSCPEDASSVEAGRACQKPEVGLCCSGTWRS